MCHENARFPYASSFTGIGFFRILIALWFSHSHIRVSVKRWGWLEASRAWCFELTEPNAILYMAGIL